jgi:phage repressor protein C with HTH and peptisase S24 domain
MTTIEQKLRAIMKATGWKQQQIAEQFDVSQATVSRWFSGSEPEGPRRDAINAMYSEVVSSGPKVVPDSEDIPVMGYIGAGAEIEPEYDQVPPEGLFSITLPFPLPDEMIAFEVRGDSMLPVYKNGSIVVVYREQKQPLSAFYGEDAAVRTSDGRRFIKTIQRGQGDRVNLFSFNAPMIEDVHLEWIGEIFTVMPRAQLRKIERQGGIQGRLRLAQGA